MNTIKIVIPVRNYANGVLNILNELKRQMDDVPLGAYRVVVVDDASTDDTYAVVSGFCRDDDRFSIVSNAECHCCGGARNIGIEASEDTDYIVCFDADDGIAGDALKKIFESVQGGEDLVLWGFSTCKNGNIESIWLPNEDLTVEQLPYAPTGVWIKAIRADKFVKFADRMMCEDCSWWYRTCDVIETIKIIREPLYIYSTAGGFSDSLRHLAQLPMTLEALYLTDSLTKGGMDDRLPSAALRNLAELYDMRKMIVHDYVKRALFERFHTDYLNLLSGRYSF